MRRRRLADLAARRLRVRVRIGFPLVRADVHVLARIVRRGWGGLPRLFAARYLGTGIAPYDHHVYTRLLGAAGIGYTHPLAFRPSSIQTDVDTTQGSNSHHLGFTWFDDEVATSATVPTMAPGTIRVVPSFSGNQQFDCPGNAAGCTGSVRMLSERDESVTYDECGKVLFHSVAYLDPAGGPALESDEETKTYTVRSCPEHFLQSDVLTSTTPAASVTRTTRFTPDTSSNPTTGLATGEIQTVEVEPDGDASMHLIRTLGRDARGRLESVSDQDVATGETRTTGYLYEDADGVYVTTTNYPPTASAALSTRIWRHPGLGVVVETDDPNQLAAANTYDTFGRLLSQTRADGATMTVAYRDTQDPLAEHGVNLSLLPEGQAARQIDVHLDSFGREVSRDEPIDGARRRAVITSYDDIGRVNGRLVQSEQNGNSTTIAGQLVAYDDLIGNSRGQDDLGRFDGVRDDDLRRPHRDLRRRKQSSTTRILDAMGRISIQRAELASGTSDATFRYGPFSQFGHQSVEDGSGGTDIQYDTLGRPTSVTRQTAGGPRVATYNAFGEITTIYKLNPVTAEHFETLTYGHDALGRVTSITSPGYGSGQGIPAALNRAFYWDQAVTLTNGVPTGTTPVQKGLGNLIDAIDFNNGSQIHQQFDTRGLLWKKTWTLAQPQSQTFTFQYLYDSQGRLHEMTYPAIPGETAPFGVRYVYNQFTGMAEDLLDATDPNALPIWSVTDVNEHGQISHEICQSGALPQSRRQLTTSFPPDRRRASV